MKKILIMALVVVFSIAFCGCFGKGSTGDDGGIEINIDRPPAEGPASSGDNDNGEPAPEPEPAPAPAPGAENKYFLTESGSYIFDFAALSGNNLPIGVTTANKLAEKYGPPASYFASYFSDYGMAYIQVVFTGISIGSSYVDPSGLSFYKSPLADGDYNLNESDMDFEIYVLLVRVTDPGLGLPYGVKIGQSTKSDIKNAYPDKNPYELSDAEYGYDFISYSYAFLDENGKPRDIMPVKGPDGEDVYNTGSISYNFDKNGVLKYVGVQWWYSDL